MPDILLIDIGNTSATLALARAGRVVRMTPFPAGSSPKSAITKVTRLCSVEGAIMSSVVPSVNGDWSRAVRKHCCRKLLTVSHKLDLGIRIRYPKPATIGADRLANACGAMSRHGCPVIVADFGTALTFDVISANCEYIGGVIAPGLSVMTDHLSEKTALLPKISLRNPSRAVGHSTVEAMRIGAKIGYRGMVREILGHLRKDLGGRRVKLCATGGYAAWVLSDLHMGISLDPDLTLYGMSRIYERNTT